MVRSATFGKTELTVGHLFHAAFQNMADNYYACALRLSPDQAWGNLVFSGGLGQIDILRQLICDKFQKDYRLCPTAEDTLLGLLALALAFTGRAGSVAQARLCCLRSTVGKVPKGILGELI